jgi:uncharacterized protein (TIGR04562 family)
VQSTLKQLSFDWNALRVALEGHSFLDVHKLDIRSKQEAARFLESYGYDVTDAVQKEEIWRVQFQAIAFIREQLLDPGEKIPAELLQRGPQSDVVRLVMDASQNNDRLRSRWACAILRVMHIISHLDNDVRLEYFNYAREQIFGRFDAHISQAPQKRRWRFGQGDGAVTLVRYIKKERKERNSILIKLLSKPLTVVEEIYDRIGFRYVTENRYDCYRLIETMKASGALCVANLQPGRAVNTLMPFDGLKSSVERLESDVKAGTMSPRLVKRALQKLEEDSTVPFGTLRNPHSSRWYRAIQFTGRQLIKAPDPTFQFWKEVQASLLKTKGLAQALKKVPISIRETRTFYYPFEVQIMDVESYVESIGGRSRHRDYKAKQRLMARNRVLRDLV